MKTERLSSEQLKTNRRVHLIKPLATLATITMAGALVAGGVDQYKENVATDHANYSLDIAGNNISIMGEPLADTDGQIQIAIKDGEQIPFAFGHDYEASLQQVDVTLPSGEKLEHVNVGTDAFHDYYTQQGDTLTIIAQDQLKNGNILAEDGSIAPLTSENVHKLVDAMSQLNGNTSDIAENYTIIIPDKLSDNV